MKFVFCLLIFNIFKKHFGFKVKEALKNSRKKETRDQLKKPSDSNTINSFLVDDLPEDSIGIQINIDGSIQINIANKNKVATIIHHHGDFESLFSYASLKKETKTPPESKVDNRKVSEITRQYLYFKAKTAWAGPEEQIVSDDPKSKIDDVKFIKDYQDLIKFCFQWLGKPLPNKFKLQNDLFKVCLVICHQIIITQKLNY